VRAQVARALDRGAALATGERLVEWRAGAGEVTVSTDHNRYAAAALVLTVGSWSRPLLGDLEVVLRVTRQPLFWVRPQATAAFAFGRCPCWALQRPDLPGLFYGFPALPGSLASQLGVKLAHHLAGEDADPDLPRRPAERDELDAVLAAVAPFLPGLSGPLTGAHVCLYTSSADGHFIIDVHPRYPNVVFACGFSGHGFKFAPVVGEALADLALDGGSVLPIGFLGLR
jgi:glycine/D-amino acid oxidase-like deaminating enzyme